MFQYDLNVSQLVKKNELIGKLTSWSNRRNSYSATVDANELHSDGVTMPEVCSGRGKVDENAGKASTIEVEPEP